MFAAAAGARRPVTFVVAVLALCAAFAAVAGPAGARNTAGTSPSTATQTVSLPAKMWGIEVGRGVLGLLGRHELQALRHAGVNLILARRSQLNAAHRREVASIAHDWGFKLAWPIRARGSAAKVARDCRRWTAHVGGPCAVFAGGRLSIAQIAAVPQVDLVVARLAQPHQMIALSHLASAAKIVGLPNLSASPAFRPKAWAAAIRAAGGSSLHLAVAPRGAKRVRALASYVKLLSAARATAKRVAAVPVGAHAAPSTGSTAPTQSGTGAAPQPSGSGSGGKQTVPSGGSGGGGSSVGSGGGSGNASTGTTINTSTTPTKTSTAPPTTTPGTTTSGGGGTSGGSLYVSSSGSDAGSCSQGAPCASFNRAYQLAGCGTTVQVAPGSYPAQTITYQAGKDACSSSSRVSFQPSGGGVTVAALTIGAADNNGPKHILVNGITSSDFVTVWAASDDIYLQNLTAMSASIFGASNVTVKGGRYGPCSADARHPSCVFKIADSLGAGGVLYTPSNITIDGATIHDFTSTDAAVYHVECLYIVAGGPITIKNSKIYRCQIFNLFAQDYNAGSPGNTPPHNVAVINNWFGSAYSDEALSQVRNTVVELDPRGNNFANWTFAFNSFYSGTTQGTAGSIVDLDPTDSPGLTFTGNLMSNVGCLAGARYSYNLLIAFSAGPSYNSACGSGDVVQAYNAGNFGYANPADLPNGDWHLTASSPALGFVPSGVCSAYVTTDIDGTARSGACDAGADQR